MNKTYAIIDMYEDSIYSKLTYNIQIHGAVDPFVVTQHLFKAIDSRCGINFGDLYNAVKSDQQTIIEAKYNTFLVVSYTDSDNVRDYTKSLEIYCNDIFPFSYFTINGNLAINMNDVFSTRLQHRSVCDYIVAEIRKNTSNLSFSAAENHVEIVRSMLDSFSHFKYNDFEVVEHQVNSIFHLKSLKDKFN